MPMARIAAAMQQGVTMLVVEDCDSTREALRQLLAPFAGQVHFACNGAEGARLGVLLRPTILFTDVRMPGLSGPEMARVIRRHSPHTRVIFTSGHHDEPGHLAGVPGAVGKLDKPLNLGHLFDLIELALDGWHPMPDLHASAA